MTSKVHLRADTSTRGTSAPAIEVQHNVTIRQIAARFRSHSVNVTVNKKYNNSNSNASRGDACL